MWLWLELMKIDLGTNRFQNDPQQEKEQKQNRYEYTSYVCLDGGYPVVSVSKVYCLHEINVVFPVSVLS